MGFHPGQEFGRTERFGNIVHGSEVKPFDNTVGVSFAGQENHGGLFGFRVIFQKVLQQQKKDLRLQKKMDSGTVMHGFFMPWVTIHAFLAEHLKPWHSENKV